MYPVVAIPPQQLKPGEGNQFRMKVSDEHSWNWPRNLIYGVHFRVYYDPAKKSHPTGRLVSPSVNAALCTSTPRRSSSERGHAIPATFTMCR